MAELRLAYRSRGDSLADALEVTCELDGDDARLTRRVLLEAATTPGIDTVGDLIDRLDQATPEQRRRIADEACEAAGVQTFSSRQWGAERRHRAPIETRDPDGRAVQLCHEPGCTVQAFNPATGLPEPQPARRWFCEAQRAGREVDMQPHAGPRLAFGPAGDIVDLDEVERESTRARREAEAVERRHEVQRAEREQQAAELREHERARDEQLARALPYPLFRP
jgi:hypothetical protein